MRLRWQKQNNLQRPGGLREALTINHHFQKYVAWSGLARTWPWPSGAGGEASGAGPGTLGTPGLWGPGTLRGHWLRLIRHLARPWPGPGQARPGNIFLETMVN